MCIRDREKGQAGIPFSASQTPYSRCDSECWAGAVGAVPVSYTHLTDRMPFAMRPLTEVLMPQQQIGYVGYETIDAKLIRPDAIHVMEITG